MDAAVFNQFRQLIYAKSGITLRDGKEALVSARIGKRMRVLGLQTHEQYLESVRSDDSGNELVQLLDAISTNLTSFFRESDHFDFLHEAIQKWADSGQRRMRMWSAASSTGEEPYSMAMTALDALNSRNVDCKILATDISTRVLRQCQLGEYPASSVDKVPPRYRSQYFLRRNGNNVGGYSVTDEVRRMVVFRRLNLSTPPFPMKGPLDIVFCRNVMIYFDNEVRMRLLNDIYRLLKPGGFLMVGHSESLMGLQTKFKPVRASVYTK